MKKMIYNLNMTSKKTLLFLAAIVVATSAIAQSLSDGLQLHYSFKEALGPIIMDQVGENHGTLINGATIGSGDGHNYLDLIRVEPGVTARPYMEIGPGAGTIIAALEDFTIAFFMWVPADYVSDFTWEFSNSFDQENEELGHMFFDCVHQKTTITLTDWQGEAGNKIDLNSSVPTDVWFHYAFTLENYLARYYVDAVQLDTATFSNLPKDLGVTMYNWIGRCGYDGGGDLAGQYNVNPAKIADFRLYNRALSTDEITALSNGEGEQTSVHLQNVNSGIDIYPNPLSDVTTISYRLSSPEVVKLEIYNIVGKRLETLVNNSQAQGVYNINWIANNQPAGIYFYKLQIGSHCETGKLVLHK
jgi:hypothetical protein